VKLRSLNIKGFKSFANDTTIHFNDEIIGVVGPNGSGKSNIVDSIRWVLGEQKSKELRLEKMVDVIFNGTKTKKKAGMASVSLTFENSKKLIPLEYENVKVTRILYANNDSEYRINDTTCRLKDIRNLFMDTGIGSNSYSIIELGMVDDILTDKDQARRKMFEQAAGIAKYKSRKRETLLKLKSTQGDLDRIQDILYELEGNLKKFERQAKRTRKYYELKEQYKDLSIKKAVLSQKEAIEKESAFEQKLNVLQEAYAKLANEGHSLEAAIEATKKDQLDSEQKLSHKQKAFSELMDELRKLEGHQEMNKQNFSFVEQNMERVQKNIQNFTQLVAATQSELTIKETALGQQTSKREELESSFLDWQIKYETIENKRQNIQGESSSDLEELKLLEEEKFQLEKSIIEINSHNTNQSQNNELNLSDLTLLTTKIASLNNEKTQSESNLLQLDDDITALTNQKSELTNRKEELLAQVAEQSDRLIKLNRRKDAQSNELDLLVDMMNNLEGFPESSKYLAKEWGKAKPVLSDILTCKDEYRSTIEAYLEPYLNYFILKDISEAKASINLLKNAQKGKAKFFILSSFEELPVTQILYDHLGEPALNVVSTDTRYDKLINHLLSKVVIVDSSKILDDQFPDEDVTYVSKSGDSNRTRHIVTGGSIGLFDGKRIGRSQEIKKLKTSIAELEKETSRISKNIASTEVLIENLTLTTIEEQLGLKTIQKNEAEIKRAQLTTQLTSAQNSYSQFELRIKEHDALLSQNINKLATLRTELEKKVQKIDAKKEFISSQSGTLEEITKAFGETSSHFHNAQLAWVQYQNEVATMESELNLKKSQLSELHEKLNEATRESAELSSQRSMNEEGSAKIKQKLITIYETREAKQAELNNSEQAFFSKRNVISSDETKLRALNKQIQDKQLEINNLKDELTTVRFELRSGMERLKIEFDLDIKSLSTEEVLATIEDSGVLQESYDKVKKRIDNYGEINSMAVEAYDEISERYVAMESQRNDIIEAKASLLETIKEIDLDAKDKFLDAFNKAKENFKEVFRSLFSAEDDCDLVLLNPEEPLNSNIEIMAKPKGKRPKVLNQLSGGEKTLTATALLFSLYLLKPAPFCIFDEVDAPLDDLNIQKFSKLIRRFADESQFIIITHNKSTMANLDLLYGVYMQEQGVSGITKVDFREYEHSEVFQTVNLS